MSDQRSETAEQRVAETVLRALTQIERTVARPAPEQRLAAAMVVLSGAESRALTYLLRRLVRELGADVGEPGTWRFPVARQRARRSAGSLPKPGGAEGAPRSCGPGPVDADAAAAPPRPEYQRWGSQV